MKPGAAAVETRTFTCDSCHEPFTAGTGGICSRCGRTLCEHHLHGFFSIAGALAMLRKDRVHIRNIMLIACMIVGGPSVAAQELPDSIVGKRVRVHFHSPPVPSAVTDPRDLFGRVEEVMADSVRLLLVAPGAVITFPIDRIRRLDISMGFDRPREAAITGLGGAAIFVALSFVEPMRDDGLEAALLGGSIGFVIGAVAGALLPDERWRRVYP